MSTPFPLAVNANTPTIDSNFCIVEVGSNGSTTDLIDAVETEIATEFAAAGVTAPPKGTIKSMLISNDHATEKCYLKSKFMTSGVSRGILLDAGDAIFLALGSSHPPASNAIEFAAAGVCTLSVACFY